MLHLLSSHDSKRSPLWRMFSRVDQDRSVCKLCDKIIKTTESNTSGLRKHAERFHKKDLDEVVREKQSKSDGSEAALTDLLAMAVATSGISFRFVQNPYFKKFLEDANINLNINRESIKRVLTSMARNGREETSKILKNADNLCVSFDGWTSKNFKYHLFAVFLIFVDENYQRRIEFVNAPKLEGRATSENIAQLISEALSEVGVTMSQVSFAVTDAGSNVVKVCRDFQLEHVFCVCHQLSLFFKDVLSFSDILPIIQKSQKVAAKLSKSTSIRERFLMLAHSLGEEVEIPKSFSITRWGGGYMLMRTYIECYKVLLNSVDFAHLVPTTEEQTKANICIEMLDEVLNSLTKMESDNSTASMIIPEIIALKKHFESVPASSTHLGERIQESFDNRFDKLLDDDHLLNLALMDPRFSFSDDVLSDTKWESVRINFQNCYAWRFQNMNPGSISSSCSQSTSSGAPSNKKKQSAIQKLMSGGTKSTGSQTFQKELISYKTQLLVSRPDPLSDPLIYWYEKTRSFPMLSTLAREALSIPSSSACTERLFSQSTHLVSNVRRNRLKPETISTLLQVSSRASLKANSKIFIAEEHIYDSEIEQSDDENDTNYVKLLPLSTQVPKTPLLLRPDEYCYDAPTSPDVPKIEKNYTKKLRRKRNAVDSDSE